MLQRIRIGRHERGFLHRTTRATHSDKGPQSEYLSLLTPGVHWIWGFGRQVETVSLEDALEVEAKSLPAYLEDPAFQEQVLVADIADNERALIWVNGRIHALIGAGRRAFWTGLHAIRLEVFTLEELHFAHPLLDRITKLDSSNLLQVIQVPAGHHGLLYIDNAFERELIPGRYAFWTGVSQVRVENVDLREQSVAVAGQEMLTADKVSLRLTLTAAYTISDARQAVETTTGCAAAIYRDLQLVLRRAVGTRTLDELLSDKASLSSEIRQAVAPRAAELGIRWGEIGVRDVILPGDMKALLNQVIEAEKRAKANLISRREETAATRSLLNTARLIESSPTLLRLKELEAAERIASSIDSVQVVGGGVSDLIRQLLPSQQAG